MTILVAGIAAIIGIFLTLLAIGIALVFVQGRRAPEGDPVYVAMGSSFAAGIGLGPRVPGSPVLCMRTINSYPQQLARLLDVPIVDVTSSGATTRHVLHGGQYFQRAQLDALGPDTRLVTLTCGGNDIGYVGDLSFLAARQTKTLLGWLLRRLWRGPKSAQQRDYDRLREDIIAVVAQVRRRSPGARMVLVTYPTILPPSGTCDCLGLSAAEVAAMREVGQSLADATKAAAEQSGALLVDIQQLSAEHHACASAPWVNGWHKPAGTRFHPTLSGAREIAAAVAAAID